jgi:4-amino-4-deoxy-L-arabinose transferase-like glycosyltransferase
MMALCLLIVTTAIFAAVATGPNQYLRTYLLAFIWGIGVGWMWTVNKLTASSVIPEGQDTELMGVFLFAGQCLSWLPPLVYTAINEAGVSQRVGVASLDVYLIISLFGYCFMGKYTTARAEVNRETVYARKNLSSAANPSQPIPEIQDVLADELNPSNLASDTEKCPEQPEEVVGADRMNH